MANVATAPTDDFYRELGKRLVMAREVHRPKITQRELAEHLGVTDTAVTRWESGVNRMEPALIRRAADFLGVSISFLYGEEPLPKDAVFAYGYPKLSDENREVADRVIQTLLDQQERQAKG